MGRVGWIGLALLLAGASALAWGLHMSHLPKIGLVALSTGERTWALVSSLGLVAVVFGLVMVAVGQVQTKEEVGPIHWRRAGALFLALAILVYLALQGPELLASAWGKDRAWASGVHDWTNGSLLALTLVFTIQDLTKRRKA